MKVVVSNSSEVATLPWKVEVDGQIIFCKRVQLYVPATSEVHDGKQVLTMDGDVGWNDLTSTVSIV